AAAVLAAALAAGALDEDAAHGLGGRGEEVAPALPLRGVFGAPPPQVRLVYQRGRLQGLAEPLLGPLLGGALAQLVVDQRQQLLRGGGVALLDGRQDVRHLAHGQRPEDVRAQRSEICPRGSRGLASPSPPNRVSRQVLSATRETAGEYTSRPAHFL